MKKALLALNKIKNNGVIGDYAIGGAVGASFYIEATATEDIDVFVFLAPATNSLLISLEPIYTALKAEGGIVESEYVKLGSWPVQILPAYKPLVEEALDNAISVKFGGIPTQIFTPEYLCAIALDTGRTKDYFRVSMFLEQNVVDINELNDIIDRFDLQNRIKHIPNWPSKLDKESVVNKTESSYMEAKNIGNDKEKCDLAANNKSYIGSILGITENHVIQNLGKTAVIHCKSDLDRIPRQYESVSIKYEGGCGTVLHRSNKRPSMSR